MVHGIRANYEPDSHPSHAIKTHLREIIGNIEVDGGLIKNRFGMLYNIDPRFYYIHHPSTIIVTLYIFKKIFGESFMFLLPLFVSLSIVVSIYYFISKSTNIFVGFWCAFLTGMHPLFLGYSLFFAHDPMTLLLTLLVIMGVSRSALESNLGKSRIILLLILAMMYDWLGYFVSLYVFLYYFVIKRRMKWDRLSLILFLLPFTVFALFLLHIKILTGSFNFEHLVRVFIGRISNAGERAADGVVINAIPDYKNCFEFLIFFKGYLKEYFFDLPFLIVHPYDFRRWFFLAGGFILLLFSIFNVPGVNKLLHKEIRIFLSMMFFTMFSYLLVFNSFTYYHNFSLLNVVPFFAVSAVLLIYIVIYGISHIFVKVAKIKSEMFTNLPACLAFNGFMFYYAIMVFKLCSRIIPVRIRW
ncbi:MAG: hypothetical protein AMJ95_01845 [Omnitrophica WOR_2 bacterium SM23_72]|nr:MAG: hypothetical protein AMJ95_01845 [Omnitrophica WOR_2 bacterium SM23_72]